MADKLISRQALLAFGRATQIKEAVGNWHELDNKAKAAVIRYATNLRRIINNAPAVDAVEVSAEELKFLINDTIAYIWRMEDSGRDKPEFGYDSRKALLEKLKQFGKEHFPEMACSYGERRGENAAD